MSEQPMEQRDDGTDAIELRLQRALETRPEARVPDGFAARVAARVPGRRVAVVTSGRYGLMAMRIAMAVLVLALVTLTMLSMGRTVAGIAVEWILCAQLAALVVWRSGVWKLGEPGV
jgi:hypothetical protein